MNVNALSDVQLDWVFENVKMLTKKYMHKQQPFDDNTWNELVQDVKKIVAKSRDDELCCQLCFVVYDFFKILNNGKSESKD